jgi:hypothetical protein
LSTIVWLLITVCHDNHRQNCEMFKQDSWRGPTAMQECLETRQDLMTQMSQANKQRVVLQCYPQREKFSG